MYQTQRIKLVPFAPHCFDELVELFCKNQRVMQSTLKGRVYTLKELMQLVAEKFVFSSKDKSGFLCLLSKESNEFIGVSGLLACEYGGYNSYEFGFILKDTYWGRGMATELGEFWLNHADKTLNLKNIMATVSPENEASQNVMRKLLMNLEQELIVKDRGKRLLFVKEF